MTRRLIIFGGALALVLYWSPTAAQTCTGAAAVAITIQNCTAAAETDAEPMRIFPNPAAETLWVVNPGGAATLQMFDVWGKMVLERKIEGDGTLEVAVGHLVPGVYLVRGRSEKWVWKKKVQILKR